MTNACIKFLKRGSSGLFSLAPSLINCTKLKIKVKWSRYRPGLAQRVSAGVALFFHDRGTSRGWVVSSTPQPHFTPGKDPAPILQEVGWAPGSVWTGGKSRPHRDSISDRPSRSQSLYRLSYLAHKIVRSKNLKTKKLSCIISWRYIKRRCCCLPPVAVDLHRLKEIRSSSILLDLYL